MTAQEPQWPGQHPGDGKFQGHEVPATPIPPVGPVRMQMPPDPATLLARLRQDYRHWGIVWDGRTTWTAIRSPLAPISSNSALGLRAILEEVTGRRTGRGPAQDAGHGGES